MKLQILIILSLFLVSCRSKQKAEQQVLALKELSDLATVEYVVTKIIKASDDQTWYKFGDRKILMSCQATLKAGIDLSKIDRDKINISGEEISLVLPEAKLISISIKPEDIRTEYEDVGLLRSNFSVAEKDALLAQGEAQIKSSVSSLGIIQTAETNASLFVTNFLRQLGYKQINISFRKETIDNRLN